MYPCMRSVSGTTCPDNALKLSCAGGGSGTSSGRVSCCSWDSDAVSLSSTMIRKREEEHLCPLEYFSSHWKHSPFSRRMASSSGVSRLKGTLEEVVRAGVGNSGGLVDDVGNSGCWELEEAPVTDEGLNVFRASFCFSSCNLVYATT